MPGAWPAATSLCPSCEHRPEDAGEPGASVAEISLRREEGFLEDACADAIRALRIGYFLGDRHAIASESDAAGPPIVEQSAPVRPERRADRAHASQHGREQHLPGRGAGQDTGRHSDGIRFRGDRRRPGERLWRRRPRRAYRCARRSIRRRPSRPCRRSSVSGLRARRAAPSRPPLPARRDRAPW